MSQAQPKPAITNHNPSDIMMSQEFVKADEYRKIIEVEVLRIIKILAENGETPREHIQNMAASTLDLVHAGMSLEELFNNVVKLDDSFPELAPVVVKVMRIYEEKYEKNALDQVSLLVKGGQYDQANDMVKKVLLFKVA
jgi:hypothetical protein